MKKEVQENWQFFKNAIKGTRTIHPNAEEQ